MQPNTDTRVLTPSHVKHYLKQRGMAPLSDLINRFDAPTDAVVAILEFWQQRGMVRKISAQPAASCSTGGCGSASCSTPTEPCQTATASNDLFEWLEPSAAPVSFDALVDFSEAWQPRISHKT
jgi:hypothetical protein